MQGKHYTINIFSGNWLLEHYNSIKSSSHNSLVKNHGNSNP